MQRVKLFRAPQVSELEELINDWIRAERVRVINVSISEDATALTAAILVES